MSNESSPKPYLVIDTNIIQFAGTSPENRSRQVVQYILDTIKKGYTGAISQITIYEAIQRLNEAMEDQAFKILNLFTHLDVTKKVLIVSAWLADLYRKEGIPDSQISDCDKIIAATAFITGSLVLTSNPNDFPRPFFSEKDKKIIIYKNNKDRDAMIIIYLLEPDHEVTNRKFLERQKDS